MQEPGSGNIKYINNTFWQEKYCVQHRDHVGVVSCTSCLRLRMRDSDSVVPLGDGRFTCLMCLGPSMHVTTDAQPLYQNVLSWYSMQNMRHREEPPFMLVEHSALNEARASDGHGSSAVQPSSAHTRGICLVEQYDTFQARGVLAPMRRERHVNITAILVLSGMPWLLTGTVLAHELMHAWLRMEGYRELPQHVEEGLCQLMAYLWLEAQTVKVRTCAARFRSIHPASSA
jgi:hypothetical protein